MNARFQNDAVVNGLPDLVVNAKPFKVLMS